MAIEEKGNKPIPTIVLSKKHSKLHFSKKTWGIVSIVIVLVLIVGGLLYWRHWQNANTAFTINGQRYYRSKFDAMVKEAAKYKVSSSAAKAEIVTITKNQYVAQKMGIQIPNSQVVDNAHLQYTLYTPKNGALDDWQMLISWNTLFGNTVALDTNGGYQGAVLYFPFDILFVQAYPSTIHPKGYGDAGAIAANQTYAQQQAQSYHDKLVAKSITSQQVIDAISKDSQLQSPNSGNGSFQFTSDLNGKIYITVATGQILTSDILNSIKQLGHPGVTPIATINTPFPSWALAPGKTSPVDVAYYFVDLQNITPAQPNFQKNVNSAVTALKVRVYE